MCVIQFARSHRILRILYLAIALSSFSTPAYAIAKKKFDFIIGVDGDFKSALSAASKAASLGQRYFVFFPSGEYNIGKLTGDSNQMTTISCSNVSFIGENRDNTIVYNTAKNEDIATTATLYFMKSSNVYMQDLTVENRAIYLPDARASRFVAVRENGDRFIYKNVKLLSNQDTYYTECKRAYWEDSEIHGTFDFICGEGDVFFNKCLLHVVKRSQVIIAAPATLSTWGYVFMNCTIDGTADNGYILARPWKNQPRCAYIHTIMKKLPSPEGWIGLFANSTLFAEYNSTTGSGENVDMSTRRATQVKDGKTVEINPVLDDSQAARYTVANVLSGGDNWRPDDNTKQVNAPVVLFGDRKLQWQDDEQALCWVVFKNGKFFKCVTTNSWEIASDDHNYYSVRAANAMGGLGPASNSIHPAGGTALLTSAKNSLPATVFYNSARNVIRVYASMSSDVGISLYSLNGKKLFSKLVYSSFHDGVIDIVPQRVWTGVVLVRLECNGVKHTAYIDLLS